MKKIAYFIGLISFSSLLVGCGPVATPPVSSYALIGSPVSTKLNPGPARTRLTLLVSQPIASSGYGTNKMIYVEVPFQLRSFAMHEWVAPPAEMLTPILAQAIRKTGYFYAVVTPPYVGATNYRLTTQLISLQQEFIDPTSDVRLEMQATLMNQNTDKIVASKRFQVIVPAPQNNPYSGVLAANQAASAISQQITRFILRAIRK